MVSVIAPAGSRTFATKAAVPEKNLLKFAEILL